MGQIKRKELIILKRCLKYAENVYDLKELIKTVADTREQPQIKTPEVVGGAVIMMLTQLGSLNALEEEKGQPFWRKWLGADLPSADTMGRVYKVIDLNTLRGMNHSVYIRLKRNKVFSPVLSVYNVAIFDGHEISCSYLRCCAGCLEREIETKDGLRIQYYHRNVVGLLYAGDFVFILDEEAQRPGEDEVAAATRLLKRLLKMYPRAFDIVAVDGLYLRADFFNLVIDHHKDIIAVLKDDRRDLMKDARGLFKDELPVIQTLGKIKREIIDIEGFNSWPDLKKPIRVVRSLETETIRRQATGQEETETAEWIWATTISKAKIPTEKIVDFGHCRWLVENKVFNELTTFWSADHLYKHQPNAIDGFWLTLIFVVNLFRAFVNLNIKPAFRIKHSDQYFVRKLFTGLSTFALEIEPL